MDLTEAFTPSQSGDGTTTIEKTTDYFDFVVSPPPHCTNPDDTIDEDSFLHRSDCRTTIGYLGDTRIHDSFIKETNNNTLTALPPVSTITGSLGHISHHHNHHRNIRNHGCHLTDNDTLAIDQTAQDCEYWVTEDSKEQTCNILLEDLNKYCWTTQTSSVNDHHPGLIVQRRDSTLGDGLQVHHRDCDDRQNTDGAIYTLTVLKSEPNSMDGLECCKSPNPGVANDGWTLRPNHLDLDAILNMESSVNIGANVDNTTADNATITADCDHDRQVVITTNGTTVDRYTTVMTSQYTSDEQSTFGVTVKTEPGDNNNDWKLSDRNSLQDTITVAESAAESLLRNALQGKLYPGAVTSTSLTGATSSRILGEAQTATQQSQDEAMHSCTDDLLLSQLDVDTTYRTADYEKLKNIANEVVESYCNLEPVCNVSATTVMYTLDPASGSLGTITLPADLAQVGTVTVVTTAPSQQDIVHQDSRHVEVQPQATSNQRQSSNANQLQLSGNTSGNRTSGSKPPKKYVRRTNRNSANGAASIAGGANSNTTNTSTSQAASGTTGTVGSPSSVQQRKERSLHYCSICSKGFKDKYSVNVHIRTHTGEKPFACSLCGKSFRQKAHLAKHYQTHVTQKPSIAAGTQAAINPASNNSNGNTNTSNNSSNGVTSSSTNNSGSTKGARSPTTTDLQTATIQHQQQISTTDSTIIVNCNPSS